MATSEFAKTLSVKLTADIPPEVVTWGERIIVELQEVRAVLSLTADRRYSEDSYGHCWCRKDLMDDNEPHSKLCLRARALWSKLQIEESSPTEEQEKSNA